MTLGYDPHANPPNYGKPDPRVSDNTLHIKANADFWKQKEKDIFDHLGGRPVPPAKKVGGADEQVQDDGHVGRFGKEDVVRESMRHGGDNQTLRRR